MPLVILCGRPASGKTHLAAEIVRSLLSDGSVEQRQAVSQESTTSVGTEACWFDNVVTVGDEEALEQLHFQGQEGASLRDLAYESTHKREKMLRSTLKNRTETALANKKNLVVLDHGNYIKGWRYELWCMAKSTGCKSCVVYIEENDTDKLLELNSQKPEKSQYSEALLREFVMRFEAPQAKNRWDSPLITVPSTYSANADDIKTQIIAALYQSGKKVKQHSATQAPTKRNITDMESVTSQVVESIIKARAGGQSRVKLSNGEVVECPNSMILTDGALRSKRRQFFKYVQQQSSFIGLDTENGATQTPDYAVLFIKFLKTSI